MRHAYVTIQDPIVDVLAGQTYYLLGWQNYFFGATAGFLGLPNELFNRTAQVRLRHTFETDLLNIDVAAGVFRPAQLNNQPIVMKVLIGIAGSSAVVKGEGTGELRSNPVPIFDSSIRSVDCVNDM